MSNNTKIRLINDDLLSVLHTKAKKSERKRINFDLRTTPADTSQRMLNVMEPGTIVPIHRHLKSSETIICLDGCLDWIIFEEKILSETDNFSNNREKAEDNNNFIEVARYRICPREQKYGIQVPPMTWHTVEVYEPSTILEAKDGAYQAQSRE